MAQVDGTFRCAFDSMTVVEYGVPSVACWSTASVQRMGLRKMVCLFSSSSSMEGWSLGNNICVLFVCGGDTGVVGDNESPMVELS